MKTTVFNTVITILLFSTGFIRNADAETSLGIKPKIIGGQPAPFPINSFQVGLFIGESFCGGVLINRRTVLTAAHCLTSVSNPNQIIAVLGTGDLRTGITNPRHQFRVVQFHIHEGYNPETKENDIAVIRLEVDGITRSQRNLLNQQKLATVASSAPAARTRVFVSGWGTIDVNNPGITPILRFAAVEIVSRSVCNQPQSYDGAVTVNMLCAGFVQRGNLVGGRDACQGDSGGPLIERVGVQNRLVGLVSWGRGCAEKNFPGVYTNIARLRGWINLNRF